MKSLISTRVSAVRTVVRKTKPRLALIALVALVAAVALAIAPAAWAPPSGLRPVTFTESTLPAGSDPYGVAVGDLDNDGVLDMTVANRDSGDVSVRLGVGDGTFTEAATETVGNSPEPIAIGDLNRDGKADMAVANSGSDSVSVRLGNGDGTFSAGTSVTVDYSATSLAIDDLDNDGAKDLVVATEHDGVAIRLGDGDGTFTDEQTVTVGNEAWSVATGDFNTDGKLDLAIGEYFSDALLIRLGNGDGTFSAGETQTVGSFGSSRITAVGDINNDGKADLAVADGPSDSVSVLIGSGEGTFTAQPNVSVSSSPQSVSIGDFNRDGKKDLAVACAGSDSVDVALGNGDGTFEAATPFVVGNSPRDTAVGDFNRDGKPDIAAPNDTDNTVSVLTNSTAIPQGLVYETPMVSDLSIDPVSSDMGDLNNDGLVDLVTTNYNPFSVKVLMNNGSRTFSEGASLPFPGLYPEDAVIADFDNDGKADVAVANAADSPFSTGYVSVYDGHGDGTFSQVDTATVINGGANALGVGDFNRDGRMDIAAAKYGWSMLILLGDGDGTFTEGTTFYAGNYPRGVAVDDYNNDGKLDLATAVNSDGQLRVALGNGDGTFGDLNVQGTTGTAPYGVKSGDFNRDGKRDLVVPNQYGDSITVYLGNGDGTFVQQADRSTGTMPVDLAVADLNNDGAEDIAALNAASQSISPFWGDGAGDFSMGTPVTVTSGPMPIVVEAADVENDGRLELLAARTGWTGGLGVFYADAAPPETSLFMNTTTPDGDSGWYITRPQITLSSDESGTSYYQWDATLTAGWQTYSGPFGALEDTHTLYYFSVDTAENTETTKSQLFAGLKIDTTAPVDPGLTSPTHTISTPSALQTVKIDLSGAFDGESGLDGYSASWSSDASETPAATKNLDAAETSTTSSALADGNWWFNLRTKDIAGNWTSTVHMGPFVIDATPPGPPTNLAGTPGDSQIDLSWTNPTDPDFDKTRILRSQTDFATDASDTVGQTVAVDDTDTASATDGGLSNGTLYYYTAFSRDLAGNWSEAATTTARPRFTTMLDAAIYYPGTVVSYNGAVIISGSLTVLGVPVPGMTNVTLWGRPATGGTLTELATAYYDVARGVYYATARCKQNMVFEMRFGGSTTHAPSTSGQVAVGARAYLGRPSTWPSLVRRGGNVIITGVLAPRHGGSTLLQIRRYYRGRWRPFTNRSARNYAYYSITRYRYVLSTRWPAGYRGRYSVRAYHSDASHAPSRGLAKLITVR